MRALHTSSSAFEIGAGAERTPRARDDDDAHGVGGCQHAERLEQILAHIGIECVELFRPVERGSPDVIGDLDEDPLEGSHQTRSTIIAMPWPTPMHMVTRPNCALRRDKA